MTWPEMLKMCALALRLRVRDEGTLALIVDKGAGEYIYNPREEPYQALELITRFHLELQWTTENHHWIVRARVAAQTRGSGAAGPWSQWHRFVSDSAVECVALHAHLERTYGS